MSDAESRQYEIDTCDQSKCRQWFRLRESRITASNFKLVTCRTVRFETLAGKLLQKSTVKTLAMKYGTLHEDEAAQQYSATYNITIYPVGFIINPSRSYLGCSPDRGVCDSSNGDDLAGLLEVKCTMRDYVTDVTFLKDVGGRLQLQRSHPYYEQCMGQMGLTGVKWCDFYVWCENDYHCERIAFDSHKQNEQIQPCTFLFAMLSSLRCDNNPATREFTLSYNNKMLVRHEIQGIGGNCTAQDEESILHVSKGSTRGAYHRPDPTG